MKLLEINDDTYDRPSIDMDVHTNVSAVVFQKIIREMTNIADTVTIRRYKNKLLFQCDGDYITQETDIECSDTDVDVTGVCIE
jgi:DNA polymerase III sliding clamp (beta) subunit (PCNA family)